MVWCGINCVTAGAAGLASGVEEGNSYTKRVSRSMCHTHKTNAATTGQFGNERCYTHTHRERERERDTRAPTGSTAPPPLATAVRLIMKD